MLGQQSLFLGLDHAGVMSIFRIFLLALLQLDVALSFVHREFLLPKALNLALMLLFAHSALLLGHLLESLVLGELRHKLLLEVLLEALLLSSALGLQSHLELLGLLQFTALVIFLISGILLALSSSELVLLHVELVTQVLAVLSLGAACVLLLLKLFEDVVSLLLSGVLGGLNLVKSLLLLFGVLAHHFVFESFHLLLALDQGTLLILGQDHVSLGLLHLKVLDTGHFAVLANHALDNGIDLVTLLKVFLLGFGLKVFTHSDLVLDVGLV